MWVLQQISYTFQQCKIFENRLRFDKVTESLQVGTFLRHSVYVHAAAVGLYEADKTLSQMAGLHMFSDSGGFCR